MANLCVKQGTYSGSSYSNIARDTAYSLNDIVKQPSSYDSGGRKCFFKCTTAGTTASTQPNYDPTQNSYLVRGNTITDGTATFQNITGGDDTLNVHWEVAYEGFQQFEYDVEYSYYGRSSHLHEGDVVYVDSSHDETLSLQWFHIDQDYYNGYYSNDTYENGCLQFLSVDSSSYPPSLEAGATLRTNNGASNNHTGPALRITSKGYFHGFTFELDNYGISFGHTDHVGVGSDNIPHLYHWFFEDCTFQFNPDSDSITPVTLLLGYPRKITSSDYGFSDQTHCRNCTFQFNHLAGDKIILGHGNYTFDQCTFTSNVGYAPQTMVRPLFRNGSSGLSPSESDGWVKALFRGCDFSASSALSLFANEALPERFYYRAYGDWDITLESCKLPPGGLRYNLARTGYASRISMYGCWETSGDDNQGMVIYDKDLTLTKDEAIYSNTTPTKDLLGDEYSWKVVTAGDLVPFFDGVELPRIEVTPHHGGPLYLTLELLFDTTTAANTDEFWLDIYYRNTADNDCSTRLSTRDTTFLGTRTALSSSEHNWVTTGIANPVKKRVRVYLEDLVGQTNILILPFVARPSTTLWINPMVTLSSY